MYDVVIIGAGPAGLTSALYSARANMKTLVLDRGVYGGQLQNTLEIENYSGFKNITGPELSQLMYEQATEAGAEYKYGEVQNIIQHYCPKDDSLMYHAIKLGNETIKTKTVIIATGSNPNKLGVEGEEKLAGRGVSYCAVCDGNFFRNRRVVVIGGGDSAVEEANYLSKLASHVTIVHRRNKFRAQPVLVDRLIGNDKVSVIWNAQAEYIHGDNKVEHVALNVDGEGMIVPTDGIFVYVGMNPNTQFIKDSGLGLYILDDAGYVITDENMKTKAEGIFAVGDVRQKGLRQIATAVGDGSIGAMSAQQYVEKLGDIK